MNNQQLVPMGKIIGAHGRTGVVKVLSYAESPEIFTHNEPIFLKSPQGEIQKRIVRWVKPHHRHILLALKGVNNRDAAGFFKAFELLIHRDRLPELEDGTYYWCDLMGMTVIDAEGDYLGIIERIIDTGAHDVYVVKDGKKEILLPAVGSVIDRVDLKKRCMHVNHSESF